MARLKTIRINVWILVLVVVSTAVQLCQEEYGSPNSAITVKDPLQRTDYYS